MENAPNKEEQSRVVRTREGLSLVPIPDPTILTTQQLVQAIHSAREILETRLSGMDKAMVLLQTISDRQPQAIADAIKQLKELHEEKFNSIQKQFEERDVRTEQTAKDSKVAVDAALQAAKEAVGEQNKSSALAIAKSEASTTKQIDQIGLLIESMRKGIDDKIDDLKQRITAVEGMRQGHQDVWGYVVGALGVLAALAALVVMALKAKG